jgi:hypothetical protein
MAKTSERMDDGQTPKKEHKMNIPRYNGGVKNEKEDNVDSTKGAQIEKEDNKNKLRILSIDGGGVRGVIPAAILKHLEAKLRKLDETKYGDIRLADYFDLIVGTSTGGLIAAMITTTPPYSAAEVLNFYKGYAPEIFPPPR